MKCTALIFILSYTVYNAKPNQTDNTPLVTADNSTINVDSLNNGCLRWIAVSRDLLKIFNYGDTVEITNCTDNKFNGEWIIHDTMNERYKCKIDFLVPNNTTLGKGECFLKLK